MKVRNRIILLLSQLDPKPLFQSIDKCLTAPRTKCTATDASDRSPKDDPTIAGERRAHGSLCDAPFFVFIGTGIAVAKMNGFPIGSIAVALVQAFGDVFDRTDKTRLVIEDRRRVFSMTSGA